MIEVLENFPTKENLELHHQIMQINNIKNEILKQYLEVVNERANLSQISDVTKVALGVLILSNFVWLPAVIVCFTIVILVLKSIWRNWITDKKK